MGGAPDTTHDAVVAIQRSGASQLCSGALVAPSVVLTAAHCIAGAAPGDLEVLVGAQISAPEQTIAVASLATYPTYPGEPDGLTGGVDLGVVYLAQALAVPPLPLDTTATGAELAGASVTVVGYGLDGPSDPTSGGARRAVTLPVLTVCSRLLTAGDDQRNVCFGDSGGAVLRNGALVAIVSSGQEDCATPANQTRLRAHTTWLEAVLDADGGAVACPACVRPDPSCGAPIEDPSLADAPDAGTDASPAPPSDAPPPPAGSSRGCAAAPRGAVAPAPFALALAAVVALGARRRATCRSPDRRRARSRR